ncbi:hypothetical protein [Azospirillum picis]|uniref:MAE-28990/MAE-18760-like HEPN domain-containing protein n=1 Tax=Azospirillum picis TaxID=488438 RepID=A0ABU0MSR9_9PROT|nr:hypothetical protein [Azospirillum picis]MBP2302823.1 hypothetical protein [Azospirillum picis]MDQ0536515.1 hypothetical protein [Azospirillum picis]
MTRTFTDKEIQVLKLTVSTIEEILRIKATYDIHRYIINKAERSYQDFEAELHVDYDITGTGVLATSVNIRTAQEEDDDKIVKTDLPLAPESISENIGSFPLEKATASYLFTILEVYGNSVVDIINPGSINKNKAWHEDVKGFADLRDSVQLDKACEAFGKHFAVPGNLVLDHAARRMVRLKKERNDFAHEGSGKVDVLSYLEDVVTVICQIAFMTTKEERLSVYPWEDYEGTFSPTSSY